MTVPFEDPAPFGDRPADHPGDSTVDPANVKACCAAAYSSDAVRLLLGDHYHPGGASLTRRLAEGMRLPPGAEVLDVASGRGGTAMLLAREIGVTVTGVELSEANAAIARGAADAAGLGDRVSFRVGDAERLPVTDGAVDAVICECAFCTFPDKATAAAEFARVLRPGGRIGLADVTADVDRLPGLLRTPAAAVACVADARPLPVYERILGEHGFRVRHTERQDGVMTRMLDRIEARVDLLRLGTRGPLAAAGIDLDQARPVLDAARRSVAEGTLGYAMVTAERAFT